MTRSLLLSLLLLAAPLAAQDAEWRSYGATAASTKYAPFSQIDAKNFGQLEVAWTSASADQPILDTHPELWTMVFEGTPLQVGDGPRNHSSLAHLDLPQLGWAQRNFPIITESLLFAATQAQWDVVNNSPRGNAIEVKINPNAPYLWAFDPDDGELVGRIELPRNASGQPITYMAGGKQYIAIPTGGADQPAELVALRLP